MVLDVALAEVAGVQNTAKSAALGDDISTALSTMASSLPSLRTLTKVAFGGAQILLGSPSRVLGGAPAACPSPQRSCHNATVVTDLCCFNYPGGQLLQTQFWDTAPATGPADSWTIHGLWPDHCDGTYDANCDSSREYTNISEIIQSFGQADLLAYMDTYWKDYQGDDETFWEHEWGKHGTCISTLKPSCYTNYRSTEEVVDYFQTAADLFKTLPSYQWLSAAGIVPSTSATYTSSQIQAALSAHHDGRTVTLGCSNGELNEIWYHFDVLGSIQTGEFIAADPDGTKSTCPSTGIKYLPKGTSTPTTSATTSSPTSTSAPFSGKGYLNVVAGGTQNGCIISAGTWYTTGTCATFTATANGSGFTLTSSKGKCAISSGALMCGSGVTTATTFTAVAGKLAYDGSTAFYASAVPSGTAQQTVYTTSHSTTLTIAWQSI